MMVPHQVARSQTVSLLPNAPDEQCSAPPTNALSASGWLDRAARAVLPSESNRVLSFVAGQDVPLWEQSDRPYGPYIPNMELTARWYDPSSGVEGRNALRPALPPGRYPSMLLSAEGSFTGRDSVAKPAPEIYPDVADYIRLNPWAVLKTWRDDRASVRVVQRCVYRDYPRIVLQRGSERLYLNEADAVPTKLDRLEPHYLFGQVTATYLWSTWWGVDGGGLYPFAAFLQFDGVLYQSVGLSFGTTRLVSRDSAPRLSVPTVAPMSENIGTGAEPPDTVRVTDGSFLLRTPAYTETVTLQRDTVFLLDATSGEERGRQDSIWIRKLFPGDHPVALVVTDLAWPHISSVRFWVARGATIYSHKLSEAFIRRVVERRWTLQPDALERTRPRATLRFRPIGDALRLAGGNVTIYALRGATVEGALNVWLQKERYLWAGDFIQPTPSSPYYIDVVQNVRRLGFSPARVAAQHVGLSDWLAIDNRVPRTPAERGESKVK